MILMFTELTQKGLNFEDATWVLDTLNQGKSPIIEKYKDVSKGSYVYGRKAVLTNYNRNPNLEIVEPCVFDKLKKIDFNVSLFNESMKVSRSLIHQAYIYSLKDSRIDAAVKK